MSAPGNIERPRTRGDCINGPRPCPWVSCRHHALIEIAKAKPKTDEAGNVRDARPTTIRLNKASGELGRRSGLAASAPAEVVRAFERDAIELLFSMEHTCTLDVADANPDGYPLVDVADLLGVTAHAIKQEVSPAGAALRDGLRDFEDHAPTARDHHSPLAAAQDIAIGNVRRAL